MTLLKGNFDEPTGAQIDAIVSGDCSDPFSLLGPHARQDGTTAVRVFMPDVSTLWLVDAEGRVLAEGERVHPAGLWQAVLKRSVPYRVRAGDASDHFDFADAYRFGPVLGELDVYLLAEGTHLRNYARLGAHPAVKDRVG
ncbi:MAG TPA: hypothetical protein VJ722_08745, partial [Rhodanobacteraceae bacterium]|nr:hypothetical protein [Rhodanobacteraceae bacterium]